MLFVSSVKPHHQEDRTKVTPEKYSYQVGMFEKNNNIRFFIDYRSITMFILLCSLLNLYKFSLLFYN